MGGMVSETIDSLESETVIGGDSSSLRLRPGAHVMSFQRALAATANALSFSRVAISQFVKQRWRLERLRFDVDRDGKGEILYRFSHGKWVFHFFVLSDCFPAELKVDRNFGVNWDAVAMLCEGEWTPEREAFLRRELPKARGGINDYDCLIYARGNRSGRLFDQVVDALAHGKQPEGKTLAHIGYILRTTAFIGNGAIGTKPLAGYPSDHPLKQPYHAQMCAGFLLREYVCDLVDRMAYIRNPRGSAMMEPAFRRYLGIGNSAATGLLPFLVHRPKVVQRWCLATETAFARVQAQHVDARSDQWLKFVRLITKAIEYFRQDERDVLGIFLQSDHLSQGLEQVLAHAQGLLNQPVQAHSETGSLWGRLLAWADANMHPETGETLRSILLELYPEITESLASHFEADEYIDVVPGMSLGRLASLLSDRFAWALQQDIASPDATHYFWYRSKAAPLDMRRGVRGLIPGDELEMGTELVRKLHQLRKLLAAMPSELTVAELLLQRPELRYTVARVQSTQSDEYAELRTNYLDKDYSPYAAIRLLLAFYGMEKLTPAHPKSVRGALLQGAPTALDVEQGRDGDWPFPLIPKTAEMVSIAPQETWVAKLDSPLAPKEIAVEAAGGFAAAAEFPVISPTELARFSQKALQAHGLDLATSLEGSEAVKLSQVLFGTGLADLLGDLDRGKMNSVELSADVSRLATGVARLCATQRNALSIAQECLDLACAGAQTHPNKVGAVQVEESVSLSLLDRLVLQAARRGFVGCLLWWSPGGEETLGKARVVMAGPSSTHSSWFVAVQKEAPSKLYRQMTQSIAETLGSDSMPAAAAIPTCMDWAESAFSSVEAGHLAEIKPGVVLICANVTEAPGAADSFYARVEQQFSQAENGPNSVCLSADALDEIMGQALSSGLPLPMRNWESLLKYAAELLIDPENEVILRPDGLDPQAYL